MTWGDIIGLGATLIGFVYVLGFVFYLGYQWVAKLRLRPVYRRTVRALISVIQSDSSEDAKISQMRSRYSKYVETFNEWHDRRSPPRLSVYLENIAIDLDSMEPAKFKSYYNNVEVTSSTREALHSFAEKIQAREVDQSRPETNETTGSSTDYQDNSTNINHRRSSPPKADVQKEVEAYKDDEARYRRQTLRATYISIAVVAVVGVLGFIGTLVSS